MNCSVDIGNTLIKIGYFNQSKLLKTVTVDDFEELLSELERNQFDKIIISSVGNFNSDGIKKFDPLLFSHETKINVSNKYSTPKTLGIDRLAAVIGARSMFSQKNILVIDAGTCITYDYINSNSEYLGGGISPGINMKFKALHNFTSKLPLIDAIESTDLIGNTTEKSIMSGVINGTIAEISGIIERYKNINDNFALVFCGGDAKFLSSSIDYQCICEENLVLIGLNEVLNFNE